MTINLMGTGEAVGDISHSIKKTVNPFQMMSLFQFIYFRAELSISHKYILKHHF